MLSILCAVCALGARPPACLPFRLLEGLPRGFSAFLHMRFVLMNKVSLPGIVVKVTIHYKFIDQNYFTSVIDRKSVV